MADAIKNQRAQVKGKVTRHIRKLKSSMQLGATSEKINKEASELEELFDNLNDLHIEYEEASYEQDEEYLKNITEEYNSIMKLYYNSLREADAREMAIILAQSAVSGAAGTLAQSIVSGTAGTLDQTMVSGVGSMSLPSPSNLPFSTVFDTKGNVITYALQSQPLLAYGHAATSTAASFPSPTFIPPSTAALFPPSVSGTFPHGAPPATIHTKKPSLPTFSGERADWPEFKCVWRPLAEGQFAHRIQLAMELKRCCKGRAADKIRHIYVTSESAYEEIWARLSEDYDDPGMSSQAAINQLATLRAPDADNYEALVRMMDTIEGIHSQLKELNHLGAVHTHDVDRVSMLLPKDMRVEWFRRYRDLPQGDKIQPFTEFVSFLRRERSAIARLAERTSPDGTRIRRSILLACMRQTIVRLDRQNLPLIRVKEIPRCVSYMEALHTPLLTVEILESFPSSRGTRSCGRSTDVSSASKIILSPSARLLLASAGRTIMCCSAAYMRRTPTTHP